MQDAHGRSGPEEEQEEDIDEGDIPDDEAGEEEDEVADAFSEPEDADHQGQSSQSFLFLLGSHICPWVVRISSHDIRHTDAKPDNAASNGEPQDL